jgi:hypothetical protein
MIEPHSNTRPKGVIGDRKDTSIATIILYTDSGISEQKPDRDILNDLDTYTNIPEGEGVGSEGSGDIKQITLDGVNNYYGVFNNFVLTNVSESESVISKVHMNFSDSWNVFFFSENPTMIQFAGGFIDTEDFPYYQEFMTAYKKYMSGTKLVDNKLSMIISYDGKIVDGYITGISTTSNASTQGYKTFNMNILAKSVGWARTNRMDNGAEMFNGMENEARIKNEYNLNTPYFNKAIKDAE